MFQHLTYTKAIEWICFIHRCYLKLTGSALKLKSFRSDESRFVLEGLPFVISWSVSGCYKITINQTKLLPGWKSKIICLAKAEKELHIVFFGANEHIHKHIIPSVYAFELHQKHLSKNNKTKITEAHIAIDTTATKRNFRYTLQILDTSVCTKKLESFILPDIKPVLPKITLQNINKPL